MSDLFMFTEDDDRVVQSYIMCCYSRLNPGTCVPMLQCQTTLSFTLCNHFHYTAFTCNAHVSGSSKIQTLCHMTQVLFTAMERLSGYYSCFSSSTNVQVHT